MSDSTDPNSVAREIKRRTRRKFSSEEKIRIVLEGLKGESSIAEICRRESIHQNQYYKWSKDFLEAGKKRLARDTMREANTSEVQELRKENEHLKQAVADVFLKNRLLKKNLRRAQILGCYMPTYKSPNIRVALITVFIGVIFTVNVEAQSASNGKLLFFNIAGHYTTLSHDYHNMGPDTKTSLSVEEWGTLLSISPIWWIGQSTAIELEGGFWSTSVTNEENGNEHSLSANAWFLMPHFLLSFGTVDSAFIPYAKIGIGLFSGYQDGIPIGWGAGLGAFLPLNRSLSVRAEVGYKLRPSSSGSSVVVDDEWQGTYLLFGIGIGI
jgi:transposase